VVINRSSQYNAATVVKCLPCVFCICQRRSTHYCGTLLDLMKRLERQFVLRGVVLPWFSSCLSGRSFQVVYLGHTSSIIYISCSVPQGSLLSVRLSTLYCSVHGGSSRNTRRQFSYDCQRHAVVLTDYRSQGRPQTFKNWTHLRGVTGARV